MTSGLHTASELSGHAIVTSGVRTLTPIFNLYGTVTLVGGALYSAWIFWRKRILLHRVVGNLLSPPAPYCRPSAALSAASASPAFSYISELLGAILLFAGFLRATTPMGSEAAEQATASG